MSLSQAAMSTSHVAPPASLSEEFASHARNPVFALINSIVGVLLASLNLIRVLITFSTLTVPSAAYTVLHYSLTLQLNFLSLAFLFLATLAAAFVWLRYRHLNRYERLREVPITKDEGFNLHPDVASAAAEGDRGSLHNYLDEFLQAIRIFGFLEKPVFHELARHLQTRRLVAGDSLCLDSDFSFYIVIDGHVQVFAPLPSALPVSNFTDPFDDEDNNGYQLLNEVQSGGTLSSLFTILSLFTEDVKLGFGDDCEDSHSDSILGRNPVGGSHPFASASASVPIPQKTSQVRLRTSFTQKADESFIPNPPYGDPVQLNAAALKAIPDSTKNAMERLGTCHGQSVGAQSHSRTDSSSVGSATIQDGDTNTVVDAHEATDDHLSSAPELHMPPAQASASFPHFSSVFAGGNPSPGPPLASNVASAAQSPYFPGRTPSGNILHEPTAPNTPRSIFSPLASTLHGTQKLPDPAHRQAIGTVARATVDTTLAVIPAEAFKRLTKKFPNAAAHIVQVILARLSRVTFHTAHNYLGLTKEVMKTEKAINELACFPLPSEFYEKAGIEKLRHRFLPEPKMAREPSEDDYFRNYQDWPARNLTGTPKPESTTTHHRSTAQAEPLHGDGDRPKPRHSSLMSNGSIASPTPSSKQRPNATPWGHPDLALKTPASRTAVGPGDLLSMAGPSDDSWRYAATPTHSALPTPRAKPRGMTKLEPLADQHFTSGPNSSNGNRVHGGGIFSASEEESLVNTFGLSNFDIKTEVMECIAKSIGLKQASPSPIASSYQASPHITAQDALLQRSVFKSAFSSLSMLDAATAADDESSVTGTASSMAGWGQVGGFHPADFENEIEIKFFPAGSTLATAGESKAGLFYVIDGFLDILLPPPKAGNDDDDISYNRKKTAHHGSNGSRTSSALPTENSPDRRRKDTSNTFDGLPDDLYSTPNQNSPSEFSRKLSEKRPKLSEKRRPTSDLSSVFPRSVSGLGSLAPPKESSKVGNALDGTAGKSKARPTRQQHTTRPFQHSTSSGSSTKNRNAKQRPKRTSSPFLQDTQTQSRTLFSVGRGGIAGYLSSLLGTASYVHIKAKTDVYVGFLPAHSLERIMEKKPIVLLTLCKRLLSLLSPLILHIDSSLDWQQVNAGQVIFREGDPSDSFYIVINGRLRAIAEREGDCPGIDVLNEFGQGDSVGELDVITNSRRRTTLHAIRDSEVARMPSTLFNAISVRHPAITIQISKIIAKRVRAELAQRKREATALSAPVPGLPDLGRNSLNLKTVAIVPVTRQVPISDFASRLQAAFEDTIGGPTVFLNQSSVMGVLGRHAFSRMGKLKLAGWLADQEQKYRLVMYVVDTPVSSAWSQTSIRQADCVLLVGFGDDPATGEYERLLLSIKTTARKELVLLHPERSVPPGSTRGWLKSRPWIHAHHHVEMPTIMRTHAPPVVVDPKAVKALRNLKQKLEISLQRYRKGKTPFSTTGRPHHASDFARLARRLCGKSIGLILGGGGARGCAHLGVIRALGERGIPIDMIGGTSIGSLIGGLYAREAELVSTFGRAKRFAGRMASLWRFASDLTYPVVSYTTGHEFNRGVFKAVQETHIEDMWIPFFCNTTNITWSRMEVHTTGYAWRYIRGSMTLAGLLPPLVDEGNMLVDGGYMDNLPVTVMMSMGACTVFACDVGAIDDTSARSYGDTLSGWWVLINRWNPWSDARNIPSIPDIQGRLTYVSSVKTLEAAKKIKGCFYMRMPVEGYGTLEFGKFDEISTRGYHAATAMLDEWDKEGRLPTGVERAVGEDGSRSRRKVGVSARRNSI